MKYIMNKKKFLFIIYREHLLNIMICMSYNCILYIELMRIFEYHGKYISYFIDKWA